MSYLCWRTGPAAESSCHGGAIWAGRVIIRVVANALINGYVIRSLGHRHIIQYRPVRQIDLKQTNLMSASAQILKKKKKGCLSWDAQHNKRFLRVVPDLWTLLKNLIPQHVSSLGSDVGEGWEAVFNKTTGFASAFLAPCGRRGSTAWPIGVLVLLWSQMTRQRLQG